MDFETLVIQASDILETVEAYQWKVGQLSEEVVREYGYKALEDFAKQIELTCGVWRSPSTLRMYGHVYKISTKLNLPKDLLFSTCQAIIFSDNPVKYARLAKGGASGAEIKRAINEEKT